MGKLAILPTLTPTEQERLQRHFQEQRSREAQLPAQATRTRVRRAVFESKALEECRQEAERLGLGNFISMDALAAQFDYHGPYAHVAVRRVIERAGFGSRIIKRGRKLFMASGEAVYALRSRKRLRKGGAK